MSIFKKFKKSKLVESTNNLSHREEEEVILSQLDDFEADTGSGPKKLNVQKAANKSDSLSESSKFSAYDEIKSTDIACLGRVIAIANQKGGVGKSTTAVNLSSYLADSGYRTLIVDFDPQSNSTSGIGLEKDNIRQSIYDVLINNFDPVKAILKTPYNNLYILPSSIQLAHE